VFPLENRMSISVIQLMRYYDFLDKSLKFSKIFHMEQHAMSLLSLTMTRRTAIIRQYSQFT